VGRATPRRRSDHELGYTGTDVLVGQLSHIVGWTTSPGSPRGDDPLPIAGRNLEDNLMLLCYDQHRVIDNRSLWDTYDAATLRVMKLRHEQRIRSLTNLHDDDRSTVLCMVSDLHGNGVEHSRQTIATALLANDVSFFGWFVAFVIFTVESEYGIEHDARVRLQRRNARAAGSDPRLG
jgi:hypothetical protein